MRSRWLIPLFLLSITIPLAHANKPTPRSWCQKTKSYTTQAYALVLSRHVRHGDIDYNGIRETSLQPFQKYLCQLAIAKPNSWKRNQQLAFWINAYNASVIRAILDRLPTTKVGQDLFSVQGAKDFWKTKVEIAGKFYALDAIENKIIRPTFQEPRIHFALVSGSQGGPSMRSQPYSGNKLNQQLNACTRAYLRAKRAYQLHRGSKQVYLSKIFKWYPTDFGKEVQKSIFQFLSTHIPKADAAFIAKHKQQIGLKIIPFSWSLNSLSMDHILMDNARHHHLFASILKMHVRNGRIDYSGIQQRSKQKLNQYLKLLAQTTNAQLKSKSAQKAFWLNAYNAIVIHSVLQRIPNTKVGQNVFSVQTVKNFWKKKHTVAKQSLSLDEIQNKILRPKFKDPRIHFGLASASLGGPDLMDKPFTPKNIHKQLPLCVRKYIQHQRAYQLDTSQKKLRLSKIFDWYKKDFGSKNNVIQFLSKHSPNARKELAQQGKSANIEYIPFSWKLNVDTARINIVPPTRSRPVLQANPAARNVAATPAKQDSKTASPKGTQKEPPKKPAFSHDLFATILRRHVRNERVDYRGIRSRSMGLLKQYLKLIANTNPRKLRGYKQRFAFWINAYNAVTIQGILNHNPRRGLIVTKIKGFWKKRYRVGRRMISLDAIENKILRPRYKDARLHFALVCAARGCPGLINRPYKPRTLFRQMTRNARRFFATKRGFQLDRANKVARLSKLFQWYKKDFVRGKDPNSELKYVARFIKKADATFLRKHYKEMKIQYIDYSWKLNIR